MRALVFFVMARSTKAGSILKVTGSLSTSFAIAPVYLTALAAAIIVKAGKITSSPAPMPSAANQMQGNGAVGTGNRMLAAGFAGKSVFKFADKRSLR